MSLAKLPDLPLLLLPEPRKSAPPSCRLQRPQRKLWQRRQLMLQSKMRIKIRKTQIKRAKTRKVMNLFDISK